MSKRDTHILLQDILEACQKIGKFIQGMDLASFVCDEKTGDAIARNLEIIGEAASRLPDEFTKRHAEIEWLQIIGLRHRIVHEYFGVDLEIIWEIVQNDIPELSRQVQNLLATQQHTSS